uniref:Uncharacterized protein n=1 Tax=Rhizophora mucronata TaxID=61149 RepID=A0A2P2M131_RHIMU
MLILVDDNGKLLFAICYTVT